LKRRKKKVFLKHCSYLGEPRFLILIKKV